MASGDNKLAGMETSAISLLRRAVEMDQNKRFTEAKVCYQEGLQLLMEVMPGIKEDNKRNKVRYMIKEYIERAEKLKDHIEKEKAAGQYHEQIHIESGSTNHSYDQLFGRFLDDTVPDAEVEDPYIRAPHQIYNFLRLCELLVKKCRNLKTISLITSQDAHGTAVSQQANNLEQISRSLSNHNIQLLVTYSATLHDREIRLGNGWVIKIGRGLDYFKPTDSKFSLGFCDMELRQCLETTVDIVHVKNIKRQ